MKRTHLLASLGITTLGVILATGAWVGLAMLGSRPVQGDQVLAASTDLAQAAPSLLPYPVQIGDAKLLINAHHYALYNPESGKIVAGKEEDVESPIASTTKMMTTFIVARIGDVADTVTISQEAGTQIGSVMGLRPGEHIVIHNLLEGALMVSGNDAAMALAEYGGGILLGNPDAPHDLRVARFVTEMNTMAKKLGMEHTHYMDPAGLNDEGHSTALDLAKLTSHSSENPIIRKIIGTATDTVTNVEGNIRHDLRNSNRLVSDYLYDGVIGGKTGFTPTAGHCLISAATRNGMELIAVVLNTYSNANDASAIEVKKLLDWGFTNFTLK